MANISYRYLLDLTDDTGIFQHAKGTIPWREHGYCSDDVCRALIVAIREGNELAHIAKTYISFLLDASNPPLGFRNFMSFDRRWLEDVGSLDSEARVMWSLGYAIGHDPYGFLGFPAEDLFRTHINRIDVLPYLRSTAYFLLGMQFLPEDFVPHRTSLSTRLKNSFKANSMEEWNWFEPFLSYCNPLLSHAMIIQPDEESQQIGLDSLKWLVDHETDPVGFLSVTGNVRAATLGDKPLYGQQPVEVAELSMACMSAFKLTKDESWTIAQKKCQAWFDGANVCDCPVGNALTGAGHDGLEAEGISKNCGAESTISYLMVQQDTEELHQIERTAIIAGLR